MNIGVFQGSPLSPALWLIYQHAFMEEFREALEKEGVKGLPMSQER